MKASLQGLKMSNQPLLPQPLLLLLLFTMWA
jgi:hypothetical protein